MKLHYRLLESLTPEEQAAACRDTGHSLAGLADVFMFHAGVKWRVREVIYPSHIRGGHVVAPVAASNPKRELDVEVRE